MLVVRCVDVCSSDLAGFEKAWGPEHTSTLDTVNNLGVLYQTQGHLEDAERMYKHALAGYEKTLGSEHKSTQRTTNNLKRLHAAQGNLNDNHRKQVRVR